jgi:D-inositol-3-phosphate glycosyltransferase
MSVRRVAMFSVHTSPLAQPGAGDGGGMNVYVRALALSLARAGVACDVFTRREHAEQPPVLEVEEGFRVVHVPAGPAAPVPKQLLPQLVDPFVDGVLDHLERQGDGYDALHANYWLSGAVAHRLKHILDRPLVATFHTLDRVKAEVGVGDDPAVRARVESDVVRCADLVLASTDEEHKQLVDLYDADPERVEIVPPGVEHEAFFAGDSEAARRALGVSGRKVLLFVGRIQPLKGADLAVRCLAALDDPSVILLVVGGPSGPEGEGEIVRLHALVDQLGLDAQVRFVRPQRHDRLVGYYQAADVCLVPSRTESFGLVALEAAACGTPVVAAAVGGLRSLVRHGRTGFLVEGHAPLDYAAPVARLLGDATLAADMSRRAAAGSADYTWSIAAAKLRRLYGDLEVRALVQCQ